MVKKNTKHQAKAVKASKKHSFPKGELDLESPYSLEQHKNLFSDGKIFVPIFPFGTSFDTKFYRQSAKMYKSCNKKAMANHILTIEGNERVVAVTTSDYEHWHPIISLLPDKEILKIDGLRYIAYKKQEEEEMKKKAELERNQRHSGGGGCITPESIVSVVIGGIQCTKKIKDLKKGDTVISPNGKTSIVECIISSNYDGLIYGAGDYWLTTGHPVVGLDGMWYQSHELFISTQEYQGHVFSIILEKDEYGIRAPALLVGDYQVATLAHGLHEPIIEHDFLGSEAIVNQLKSVFGEIEYDSGKIHVSFVKDIETGYISSVTRP